MEVSAEAKRIMVVALGKLYSSRSQRGGLRLHRSLQLTMVMKSARDIYHAAQAECEHPPGDQVLACVPHVELQSATLPRQEEAAAPRAEKAVPGDKENQCPTVPTQQSRKRRGKAAAEPDFLPCKKAKLEQANFPQQVFVNQVLMDYVSCSRGLVGSHPSPMPLQRAVAAC